jgi:hypothetical protein
MRTSDPILYVYIFKSIHNLYLNSADSAQHLPQVLINQKWSLVRSQNYEPTISKSFRDFSAGSWAKGAVRLPTGISANTVKARRPCARCIVHRITGQIQLRDATLSIRTPIDENIAPVDPAHYTNDHRAQSGSVWERCYLRLSVDAHISFFHWCNK